MFIRKAIYACLILLGLPLISSCSSNNSGWSPPKEPKGIKSLRILKQDKNDLGCTVRKDNFYVDGCESLGIIPNQDWIFIHNDFRNGPSTNKNIEGEYPSFEYVSNIRRLPWDKDTVEFDALVLIKLSEKISPEEGYPKRDYLVETRSLSLDCSVNPPSNIGDWHTLLNDDWYYERESDFVKKEGAGILFRQWICKVSK